MNETTGNQPAQAAPVTGEPAPATAPTEPEAAAPAESTDETEVVVGEVVTDESVTVAATVATEPASPPTGAAAAPQGTGSGPLAAELAALRSELDERTGDLQRLSAEYANYRRRVERDRLVVAEQATAQVVAALLPVLDDLDRAREHGDLVGPFASMAEQLGTALAKFGLTGFGEVGDAFDPTRHEAVTHQTSAEVTAPTCVAVMRRGYQLGERLLRPALVAVADPESQ
ncbi:MAG TPA: nucleotide exchange factor GrpE [Jiangellales bacterium]|nr:nucleotide exchange factor GrpE [Jiangellales bacterium]